MKMLFGFTLGFLLSMVTVALAQPFDMPMEFGVVTDLFVTVDPDANIPAANLTNTCTKGDISFDSAGTVELCFCQAADTWYCIAVDDATGPAD